MCEQAKEKEARELHLQTALLLECVSNRGVFIIKKMEGTEKSIENKAEEVPEKSKNTNNDKEKTADEMKEKDEKKGDT